MEGNGNVFTPQVAEEIVKESKAKTVLPGDKPDPTKTSVDPSLAKSDVSEGMDEEKEEVFTEDTDVSDPVTEEKKPSAYKSPTLSQFMASSKSAIGSGTVAGVDPADQSWLSSGARDLYDEAETESKPDVSEQELMQLYNTMQKLQINPSALEQSGLPDFMKQVMGNTVVSLGVAKATPIIDMHTKYRNSLIALKDSIRQETLSSYMDSQGNFTPEGIARMRAEGKTMAGEKRTPSRQGLDQIIDRGATQMDMPEFPEEDKKILAKMVSAGFSNVMKGIALQVAPTDRSAQIAALMENPGIQIMAGVAPMLASDIAAYKGRVQQVEDKNVALMERYNDKLDAAMAQYDSELNVAEREYSGMIFNSMLNRMKSVENLFNMSVNLEQAAGQVGMAIDSIQTRAETQYVGDVNRARRSKEAQMNAAYRMAFTMWKKSKADKLNNLQTSAEYLIKKMPTMSVFSANMNLMGTAIDRISKYKMRAGGNYASQANAPQSETALYVARNLRRTINDLYVNGKITEAKKKALDEIVIFRTTTHGEVIRSAKPEDLLGLADNMPTNVNGEIIIQANPEGKSGYVDYYNKVFMKPYERDGAGNVKRTAQGKPIFHSGWVDTAMKTADNFIYLTAGDAERVEAAQKQWSASTDSKEGRTYQDNVKAALSNYVGAQQ